MKVIFTPSVSKSDEYWRVKEFLGQPKIRLNFLAGTAETPARGETRRQKT